MNKRGRAKIRKVLKEWRRGHLHSGSRKGPKVRSKRQALAIAYSYLRK